ncbi:unnamed protein product [Arabidopsis halleri]
MTSECELDNRISNRPYRRVQDKKRSITKSHPKRERKRFVINIKCLVGEEEETMIRNFRFRAPTNQPGFTTIQTDSRRLIRFQTRCCSSPDLSHYTILGLTPLASQTEVKRAFKRLALKYHPDVHKGQDKDFKEIKSAYECLMQKFEKEEEEMEITEMGEIDEWEEWMGFEGGIPSGISY